MKSKLKYNSEDVKKIAKIDKQGNILQAGSPGVTYTLAGISLFPLLRGLKLWLTCF